MSARFDEIGRFFVVALVVLVGLLIGVRATSDDRVLPSAVTAATYAYDIAYQPAARTVAAARDAASTQVGPAAQRIATPESRRSEAATAFAAEGAAVRGGVGPVSQGAAGVERTIADIEGAGGRILGREVTVESGGVRTRPDLFVELPSGQQAFIEVKTGASAGLTPNQSAAFPSIISGGFTPFGGNAAAAGLTPGMPYGPIPVWVVRQPWPL
jgi:hypothetical protein